MPSAGTALFPEIPVVAVPCKEEEPGLFSPVERFPLRDPETGKLGALPLDLMGVAGGMDRVLGLATPVFADGVPEFDACLPLFAPPAPRPGDAPVRLPLLVRLALLTPSASSAPPEAEHGKRKRGDVLSWEFFVSDRRLLYASPTSSARFRSLLRKNRSQQRRSHHQLPPTIPPRAVVP